MKEYYVQITDKALADMEVIYNYIAAQLQNPNAALRQYNRIAEAIQTLTTMPERTPRIEELNLHRLLVNNYSVFYLIANDNVKVVRVLYSASDIIKRLREN